MAQITKLTGSVPALTTGYGINHSLSRTPGIHVLGKGTAATIVKHTTPHDATKAYYTNTAGVPAAVEGLMLAIHSQEADRFFMSEGTSSGAGAVNIPHGLPATPDIVFLAAGPNANIAAGAVTAGPVNITINPTGAGQNWSLFAVSLHSVWGTTQWFNAITGNPSPAGGNYGQIGANGTNVAVPHGLKRAPGFVVLGARTGANVTIGTTPPDGTNVYLTNSAGAAQNFELFGIAGHSIIS